MLLTDIKFERCLTLLLCLADFAVMASYSWESIAHKFRDGNKSGVFLTFLMLVSMCPSRMPRAPVHSFLALVLWVSKPAGYQRSWSGSWAPSMDSHSHRQLIPIILDFERPSVECDTERCRLSLAKFDIDSYFRLTIRCLHWHEEVVY